jgi:multidrug resistance efflux pump
MEEKRIPLSWKVRWRRIRAQGIPIVIFGISLLASGWLWGERGIGVESIGVVTSPRVDVTSPTNGLIVALPNETSGQWSMYDRVQAGDILARIEEEPGNAEKMLEIRAPISGTIIAIRSWPGQAVFPGKLIATIAADRGHSIVGYIPEESSLTARPGMQVTLRPRTKGSPRMLSEVEEVGVQIEKVPRHQQTNQTTPQWGTPVRIKLPSEAMIKPGALVDLHFDGRSNN